MTLKLPNVWIGNFKPRWKLRTVVSNGAAGVAKDSAALAGILSLRTKLLAYV